MGEGAAGGKLTTSGAFSYFYYCFIFYIFLPKERVGSRDIIFTRPLSSDKKGKKFIS